jgi:prevent-host-death family protein
MTRFTATKARERLAEIVNEVAYGGDRVVLHRHGKDLVAMISVADLARFEELEDRYDLELMREARNEPGSNISWDELKEEVARPSRPRKA